MARQFAAQYTDEDGVEHTSHLVPRVKAIAFACILREDLAPTPQWWLDSFEAADPAGDRGSKAVISVRARKRRASRR